MKHLLAILILVGGVIGIIGVVFLFEWASENIKWFVWRRPKLEMVLGKVGIVVFCTVLICGLVEAYLEIYKLL